MFNSLFIFNQALKYNPPCRQELEYLSGMALRVRVPAGDGNVLLHERVQNGSGAHPTFYPTGTIGSSLGSKSAGA
jgi:hypothetical protein